MRNQPIALDVIDSNNQSRALKALEGRKGRVTLYYTKRNGQESTSTGTVGFFSGRPGFDTGSVTIDTEDKGPRTINLHRIHKIESA